MHIGKGRTTTGELLAQKKCVKSEAGLLLRYDWLDQRGNQWNIVLDVLQQKDFV